MKPIQNYYLEIAEWKQPMHYLYDDDDDDDDDYIPGILYFAITFPIELPVKLTLAIYRGYTIGFTSPPPPPPCRCWFLP